MINANGGKVGTREHGTNTGTRLLHPSAAAYCSSAVRVEYIDLFSMKVLQVCYLLH